MDPLLVLPTELLHRIVLLLPLGDRVRLWEVSRGWRAFVGDASLWRRVALRLDGADSLRVLLRAPCVDSVTLDSAPLDSARLRRAFRSGIQVRKVPHMICLGGLHKNADPSSDHVCSALVGLAAGLEDLSLSAHLPCLGVLARLKSLRKLSLTLPLGYLGPPPLPGLPQLDPKFPWGSSYDQRVRRHRPRLALPVRLEELELNGVMDDLDVDLSAMFLLRCLSIDFRADFHLSFPPWLEDLYLMNARRHHLTSVIKLRCLKTLKVHGFVGEPDGVGDLVVPQNWSLQVLVLRRLPEAIMLTLARSFSPTVRRLCLSSELEADDEFYIDDLGAKLRAACGLAKLKMVGLVRRREPHDVQLCQAQLKQVRRALGEQVEVRCQACKQD